MLKITKPTITAADVYSDCVNVFRDLELKARLTACGHLINEAEEEFERKITTGQIFTIIREKTVNQNVKVDELKKVYTDQMVGNPAGRVYYDIIFQSAKHGLCPLCAHRDVTTLDHYLPKACYPRLSIVPINLVPACDACNKGKLKSYPTTAEEETIHPYFDDIENVTWLSATVNRTNPVSINYFVERAAEWSDLLFDRVKGHFESFKLKKLYSTQAGRELPSRKLQIINTFDSGAGIAGVRKLLTDEGISRAESNPNSWQTVLYRTLSTDDWFCSGGFRQI